MCLYMHYINKLFNCRIYVSGGEEGEKGRGRAGLPSI